MNHLNPYSSPQSHGSVAEEAEQQGVSWRARGLSSLLGGSIGMLVGGLWSLGGLDAHFSGAMSIERWIVINVVGLTSTGLVVGASQGSLRIVGRLSRAACLSLLMPIPLGMLCGAAGLSILTVLLVGAARPIYVWLWFLGESGWWLGLVIGYVFSLIRLIVWWIR